MPELTERQQFYKIHLDAAIVECLTIAEYARRHDLRAAALHDARGRIHGGRGRRNHVRGRCERNRETRHDRTPDRNA